MPLAVVVVCVAATVGLTVVARYLLAGSGFFAAQRACVIVLAGGSVVSALLYASAGLRALRRVHAWRQDGHTARRRWPVRARHDGARRRAADPAGGAAPPAPRALAVLC